MQIGNSTYYQRTFAQVLLLNWAKLDLVGGFEITVSSLSCIITCICPIKRPSGLGFAVLAYRSLSNQSARKQPTHCPSDLKKD